MQQTHDSSWTTVERNMETSLTKDWLNWPHSDTVETLGMVFYCAAFALCLATYHLRISCYEQFLSVDTLQLDRYGRVACIVLLSMKLLFQRYSTSQLIGIIVAAFPVTISLYISGDSNVLLLFMFIIAGQGITVKQLAKLALPLQITMVTMIVVSAMTGVVENRISYRIVNGIVLQRYSLGFINPNGFGQCIVGICLSFGLIRFPKFDFRDVLPHIAGFLTCWYIAKSQTSAICIAAIMILGTVLRFNKTSKHQRFIALFSAITVLACALFSFVVMIAYDPGNSFMRILNETLSTRPFIWHSYYLANPPTLFGHTASSFYIATENALITAFDNAYAMALLYDGLLFAIAYLCVYLLTFIRCYKEGKFDECAFGLLIFAILAVSESPALFFSVNYCLIGAAYLLYGQPSGQHGEYE